MLHLVSGGVTTACAEFENKRFSEKAITVKVAVN
jgi:hypothetical protein